MFIDYGLIHNTLIDEVDQVTYELFEYRKGKGDHRGWYFDIRETALFGNKINRVYQSKRRSLQSKDYKQLPDYHRAVDEFLKKRKVYQQIRKLIKLKRSNHKQKQSIRISRKQLNMVKNSVKYDTRIIGILMFIP